MCRVTLLLPVVFLISCGAPHIEMTQNGFDAACNIFEDTESLSYSPEELGNYIGKRLADMSDLPEKNNVISIYHSLFNVKPDNRYNLFKESAEIALQRNWNCPAMKKVYLGI